MDIKGKVPFLRKVEGSLKKGESSKNKEKPSQSNKISSSTPSAQTSTGKANAYLQATNVLGSELSPQRISRQVEENQDDSEDSEGPDTAEGEYAAKSLVRLLTTARDRKSVV